MEPTQLEQAADGTLQPVKPSPIAAVIDALRAAGFAYEEQDTESRADSPVELWTVNAGDERRFHEATLRYAEVVHVDGPLRTPTGKYALSLGEGYRWSNFPALRYKQRKDGSFDIKTIVERVKGRFAKVKEDIKQEQEAKARDKKANELFVEWRKGIIGDLPYQYQQMIEQCSWKAGVVSIWFHQRQVTPEHAKALLDAIYEVDKRFGAVREEN